MVTKHWIRALFGGLVLLLPWTARAGNDASIASVAVTPTSTALSAVDVSYELVIASAAEVSNLTCYFFPAYGGNPSDSLFDGSSMSTSTVDDELAGADLTTYNGTDDTGTIGFVFAFTAPLSIGEHAIGLTSIGNPDTDGTYRIGCTSSSDVRSGDYTYSDNFDIGTGVEPGTLSVVDWQVDPAVTGAVADYTFTITVDSPFSVGEDLAIVPGDGSNEGPSVSGIDFSNAVLSSATVVGAFVSNEPDNHATALITLTEQLPDGEHVFTVSGVVNPTTAKSIYGAIWTDTSDSSSGVNAQSIIEIVDLRPPDAAGMTVNKKKAKRVTVGWNAATGAEVYGVQVRKCKNDSKKQCKKTKHYQKSAKYRKFTSVTATKKKVKQLKTATFYQWRVKSCLDGQCSDFSDWSRFRTK